MRIENWKLNDGFSMIEVVVILALVVGVSAIILVNFTGFNEGAAANRSILELALAIRRAQNMALAVTQVEVGSPPTFQIPPAIGVQLTKTASTYFLFADIDTNPDPLVNNSDKKYTPALGEKIGGDGKFERSIYVSAFKDENGNPLVPTALHILFAAPEAVITITDEAGTALSTNHVVVELTTLSGNIKKTATIRTSGQISIK